MKIIPVIDILNGVAVHAVRGRRKEYQPLQSTLCKSAEPEKVAQAFRNMGFSELYIADLDAIQDGRVNLSVFSQIAEKTGLALMVDAGVTTFERAKSLLECRVSKIILGTETLANKSFVEQAVMCFGSDRIIVSLDMKCDEVLVPPNFDGPQGAMALLREFQNMGVSQIILLDLARVGSAEGINSVLARHILQQLSLNVYVGGGVRSAADLVELKSLGVTGVLLATALHEGRISVSDLRQQSFL